MRRYCSRSGPARSFLIRLFRAINLSLPFALSTLHVRFNSFNLTVSTPGDQAAMLVRLLHLNPHARSSYAERASICLAELLSELNILVVKCIRILLTEVGCEARLLLAVSA
jgi:hypothetical protein